MTRQCGSYFKNLSDLEQQIASTFLFWRMRIHQQNVKTFQGLAANMPV